MATVLPWPASPDAGKSQASMITEAGGAQGRMGTVGQDGRGRMVGGWEMGSKVGCRFFEVSCAAWSWAGWLGPG